VAELPSLGSRRRRYTTSTDVTLGRSQGRANGSNGPLPIAGFLATIMAGAARGGRVWKTGEAAVERVSEGSGVVRLLEKEPTKVERYAHAAELLAIIQRAGTPHEPRSSSTASP
jgi:hypothetical protein